MKHVLFALLLMGAISFSSMRVTNERPKLEPAINTISNLYYKNLVSPFQFEKSECKGFFGFIPNHWLFTGPIGNESDSVLKKDYTKEDSISQVAFIVDATTKFRNALREMDHGSHFAKVDASGVFDALRVEIFRISMLDIANSDSI